MNKMLLKILVILGLIAPVCADAAYKRVDAPGVAQRKLNLLLKSVREMTESEKKQALADLSPSLREDYEEMLGVASSRRKDIEMAMVDMVELIDINFIKSSSDIDDVISVIAKANNLNAKETNQIKLISKKHLEKKSRVDKEVAKEDKEVAKEDKEVTKEDKEVAKEEDKENKKDLSVFLSELRKYFDKQLKDDVDAYSVTSLVTDKANRFTTNVRDYKSDAPKVNNFFIELQKYQKQNYLDYAIVCIQDAFSDTFFELIDSLYTKVMNSKASQDIDNLYVVMDKCNKILNTGTYEGMTGGDVSILNKKETSNKDKIIANTEAYKKFAKQLQAIFDIKYPNLPKNLGDILGGIDKQEDEDKLDLEFN